MKIYKILFLIVVFNLFNLESYARRVREVKYPALIYKYSPLTGNIIQGDRLTDEVHPYPVIATTHPISTGLWIEKMVQDGSLSQDATVIYLSPYPCYSIGEVKQWQDSNWVRFVLEKGYARSAFIVFPPYMQQESVIKEKLSAQLSNVEHDISLLDSIAQLPDADELGEVIVVVDASYFSNQQTPRHVPTDIVDVADEETGNIVRYPISLIFSTANTVRGLASKNLDIKALVYNTSPGFPYPGHDAIIQEWLLIYLERMNE